MKHIFLSITLFSILAILPVAIFAQTASNKCFSGDCVNGRGKIVYASGNTYEGDFVNGKLEGQGTYKFVDGGIYTGQFFNGVVNGKGKTIYANGDIYEGDYVNGKRQGQGIYTTKDGSYYSGEFKNGVGNGYGKHYDKSTNTTNEGIYKDDVFMGAATQSNDPKPAAPKTLAELDCRIILNFENCVNPLFNSSKSNIQTIDFSGGQPLPIGKTRGIRMDFTSGYGFLMSVEFFGTSRLWGIAPFYGQPTATLKWGDNIKKAISELGEPIEPNRNEQKIDGFTLQCLYYKGFRLLFENGKLMSVAIERNLSDRQKSLEIAASDYVEKNKTPEQKAREIADAKASKEQQMESDYKSLLNQLDTKLEEGNRIIRSEMTAIAAGGMFKNAVQKKLDKVRDAGDSLIDSFGKKYQGMIPAWMVKGIQEKWRPVTNPQ